MNQSRDTDSMAVCRACGRQLTGKRSDAIVCGATCRQRLYRQRREARSQ